MINSLLNREKNKVEISKIIDKEGKSTTSPQEISEKFNEYFVKIAENLNAKIYKESSNLVDENKFIETMGMVTPGEVYDIISNAMNKKQIVLLLLIDF